MKKCRRYRLDQDGFKILCPKDAKCPHVDGLCNLKPRVADLVARREANRLRDLKALRLMAKWYNENHPCSNLSCPAADECDGRGGCVNLIIEHFRSLAKPTKPRWIQA